MFCANVHLITKPEGVNLENEEIKSVLVMFVASSFLNKVTCTRNILETYLGDMYHGEFCSIIKVKISIFKFSIKHPYARASLKEFWSSIVNLLLYVSCF